MSPPPKLSLGRVTGTTDALGGETTMVYDAVGRATSQTDPMGRTSSCAYGDGTVQMVIDGELLRRADDSPLCGPSRERLVDDAIDGLDIRQPRCRV